MSNQKTLEKFCFHITALQSWVYVNLARNVAYQYKKTGFEKPYFYAEIRIKSLSGEAGQYTIYSVWL